MKLAEFIQNNIEPILQEWEQFAGSIQPKTGDMDRKGLRDHARLILRDIADYLNSPESKHEQADKSRGQNPDSAGTSAAEKHGLERSRTGFGITDVVAEYRFLRATVIRLWSEYRLPVTLDIDLIRFNEAVDQQIYEAIGGFYAEGDSHARQCDKVLSSSSDHGYILDLDGKFVYATKPMLQHFKLSLDELVGKSHSDLNFSEAFAIQYAVNQVIQTAEKRSGEMKHILPSGEERIYEYILSPVFNDEKMIEAVAGTNHDVSDRKLAEERAWHNANHDALTGLPNRRMFRDRLAQSVTHATRTASSLAVLFIDLDRFKETNDLLGHDTGDQILMRVAERILPCVRTADTVARLGGDEFAIILQEAGKIGHIAPVVRKILKRLAIPFIIFNETVNISACIGISIFPQDAIEPEHLLKKADEAMYAAKKAGGNRFYFSQRIQQTESVRIRLLDDLRKALPERQLEVFYQPIVALPHGRITKAEALLRWHHPEIGLILPRDFIDLAEESGLICDIGNWVFAEAVSRSFAWSDLLGVPFQISINTTIAEILTASWVNYAKHVGLAQAWVTIEVTENDLLDASEDVTARLIRLQQAGIQISVGKFGNGLALLTFLKKYNANYLKIDQSFVHSLANDPSSRTIAEKIIQMAHKLGLIAIAEGVETREQKDWLTEVECDYAQGYLFAEAVPPTEFERLLEAGQAISA